MGMLDGALETGKKAAEKKKKQPKTDAILDMTAELFMLETSKIHPDPDQPRKQWMPDELEELKSSIEETKGCHTPIKVRPHPEKLGEYMIVYGEGRWLSHNHLNYPVIPALVETKDFTPYELSFAQLTENLSRKSMTRFDEANAIKSLMDKHEPKLKQNEIAKKLGKTTSFISRLLKLIKAPKSIQKLSIEGHTQNINVLDSLTKIAELIGEEELENYIESVISGAISEKDLLQALNDFKQQLSGNNDKDEGHGGFEERVSESISDPSGSNSVISSGDTESHNETKNKEQDYGFYDYQCPYEKAIFDALIKCDLAFVIDEGQKDHAVVNLIEVTDQLIADEGISLDVLIKILVDRLGKEKKEAIKTITNRRLLRGFFRIELSKDEWNDNEVSDLQLAPALVDAFYGQEQGQEEDSNIESSTGETWNDSEVADLQSASELTNTFDGQEQGQEDSNIECFNMGSYEVFDGYVLVQPDMPHTIPIRLTKAELKELLEAE